MKKYIIACVATALAGIVSLLFMIAGASANPSQIIETKSNSATTTVTFIAPGSAVATSTLVLDTQVDGTPSETAVLGFQFTASSTLSTLNITFQYSMDQLTWFGDDIINADNATTTPFSSISRTNSYNYTFASTSPTVGTTGATSTETRLINVPTPTRYVRAVFTIFPGALNGAVWAEFVSKRQNR